MGDPSAGKSEFSRAGRTFPAKTDKALEAVFLHSARTSPKALLDALAYYRACHPERRVVVLASSPKSAEELGQGGGKLFDEIIVSHPKGLAEIWRSLMQLRHRGFHTFAVVADQTIERQPRIFWLQLLAWVSRARERLLFFEGAPEPKPAKFNPVVVLFLAANALLLFLAATLLISLNLFIFMTLLTIVVAVSDLSRWLLRLLKRKRRVRDR